jgi:DNA-binding protein HU-beta
MVSKSQLAQRIAERGATPAQAEHAVDAVLGEIAAALAAGERVTLRGFGTFEPVARPARTARNPRTGGSVPVAAATVARFHPGTTLKAAVDGGAVTLGAVGTLADTPTAVAVAAPVATKPAAPKPAKGAKGKKKDAAEAKDSKGKAAKGKKSGKKRKG